MFEIKEWSADLDLSSFYGEASARGFINNSSQRLMIDCFKNEIKWNAWILYKHDIPVGSVAAHSFDDVMGPNSFRILSRVCALVQNDGQGLGTRRRLIEQHQNVTDQFLLPKCIEWAGKHKLYATSNESTVASQRMVHTIYFPSLEKLKIARFVKEVEYRGHIQTVWEIDAYKFEENLNKFPKWS
jgi:hypothetical protein